MIFKIVAILTCILYLVPKIRLGIHMLQQEFYLNTNYFNWVKKHLSKNFLAGDIIIPALALTAIVFFSETVGLIFWSVLNVVAFARLLKQRTKAKKPLVITARVKRLIATLAVLLVIWGVAVYSSPLCAFIVLVTNLFSFLFVLAANFINMPVEKAVAGRYIRDAKKIIRKMDHLTVIGVTGSYGKTSSKYILAEILSGKFNTLMTPESYNTTMGVVRTVREKLKPIHEIFVCEMGAQNTGEIKEICDIVLPTYGIITSIGPQHLETFKTIENIIKTKFELFDALRNKENSVVNLSSDYIKANKPEQSTGYSITAEDGGKYYADDISYGPAGASFNICGEGIQPFRVETKLLGKHNILNIVGAATLALKLGMTPAEIAVAVKRIRPVPHRLQPIKQAGGILVIDDAFNSNLEGAKSAVEVLGSFEKGKRMLITPGMVELGEKEYEYNKIFGQHAAENCDYIILVGEKQTVAIKDGLKNFPEENLFIAKDLNDALVKMRSIAGPGWTVLFENDLPDLYNS